MFKDDVSPEQFSPLIFEHFRFFDVTALHRLAVKMSSTLWNIKIK